MTTAPITRQRSEWRDVTRSSWGIQVREAMPDAILFMRRVSDGTLAAIINEEPLGWHASISWTPQGERQAKRYPTWDELTHARYALLPHDVDFVMHLPPPSEYVAVHDTTFHLHEFPERSDG